MRKITIALLSGLLYTGCSTVDDDRICIDYGSFRTVEERCIPLYGAIICQEQEVTKTYCKLYAEDDYAILFNQPRLLRS